MVKIVINLDYLKQHDKIKKSIRNGRISDKTLKTNFSALDKFFPYLLDTLELDENFDLDEYFEKTTKEKNEIKAGWVKNDLINKVWQEWENKLDEDDRANRLMKWVDNHEDFKNTYLNYIWRIQGLFKNLNKLWRANPLLMDQIEPSPMHLDEDENIDFNDVIKLYSKLSQKYKLLLKMMMYTGLNPADLVELKPVDFRRIYNEKKYGNKPYYYMHKLRVKSKGKQVKYLHVYTMEFMEEIKAYFEMKNTLKYNKTNQAKKVEKLRKFAEEEDIRVKKINSKIEKKEDKQEPRCILVKEYKNFIEFIHNRDWKKDQKENIFGNIKSTAVSDALSYHNGGDVQVKVMPSTIRRLSFSRLASAFTQGIEDTDLFGLWTQHKVGIITENYMTQLITLTINKLKDELIQPKVYIENMTEYFKETTTLREKIDDIKTLKDKNKELENEMNSMKQLHKEEMTNLRTEVKSMFDEFSYKQDLNLRVNKGEMTEGEARAEYQGFEFTEEEKRSKPKRKTK